MSLVAVSYLDCSTCLLNSRAGEALFGRFHEQKGQQPTMQQNIAVVNDRPASERASPAVLGALKDLPAAEPTVPR
jgi:hypothetical protein